MGELLQIPYFDASGQPAGAVAVDRDLLGGRIRKRLLFDATIRYEGNARRGTHKVKPRSEVSGSGRKLFRQKGTGRARQGTAQAPHRKGGGVSHGPVPRSYRSGMTRKARRLATRVAFLAKCLDRQAAVIESLDLPSHRTAELMSLLGKVGVQDLRCLVAVAGESAGRNLQLASRNVPDLATKPVREANSRDVLKAHRVVLTRAALEELLGSPVPVPSATE